MISEGFWKFSWWQINLSPPTTDEHVLQRRPRVGIIPLLPGVSQRRRDSVGELEGTTPLQTWRARATVWACMCESGVVCVCHLLEHTGTVHKAHATSSWAFLLFLTNVKKSSAEITFIHPALWLKNNVKGFFVCVCVVIKMGREHFFNRTQKSWSLLPDLTVVVGPQWADLASFVFKHLRCCLYNTCSCFYS